MKTKQWNSPDINQAESRPLERSAMCVRVTFEVPSRESPGLIMNTAATAV